MLKVSESDFWIKKEVTITHGLLKDKLHTVVIGTLVGREVCNIKKKHIKIKHIIAMSLNERNIPSY